MENLRRTKRRRPNQVFTPDWAFAFLVYRFNRAYSEFLSAPFFRWSMNTNPPSPSRLMVSCAHSEETTSDSFDPTLLTSAVAAGLLGRDGMSSDTVYSLPSRR